MWFHLPHRPWHGEHYDAPQRPVSPSYFTTLGAKLLRGRYFNTADGESAPRVTIVNRTFERRFFGTFNPVGQPLDGQGTIVVGVVEDVTVAPHSETVNDPLGSEPMTYIPAAQAPVQMLAVVHGWFQPSWIVRTSGPISGLTGQMQRALAGVDPGIPFSGFYGMTDHMDQSLATQRVELVGPGFLYADHGMIDVRGNSFAAEPGIDRRVRADAAGGPDTGQSDARRAMAPSGRELPRSLAPPAALAKIRPIPLDGIVPSSFILEGGQAGLLKPFVADGCPEFQQSNACARGAMRVPGQGACTLSTPPPPTQTPSPVSRARRN